MIASWMIAATVFGLIAILAATALERSLRLLGRQARVAWMFALAITVGWPLLAPAVLRPAESRATVSAIATGPATTTLDAPASAARASAFLSSARATLGRLDVPLAMLWGAVTLLLLLRAAVAMRALRRLSHRAERRTIDGQSVLVSPAVGPAAFGIVRPLIVMPSWSLDLDPAMRAMVLRHEQEHLAARDPATLTLAWIGAALMPWNAALWIIARRLRVATELDCDHRVVRQGTDARRYAQLLLLMVQRQTPAAFAALMAGSPTTLHQRIDAMHTKAPAHPRLRAALLLIVAVIASAAAASPALAGELASVRARFVQAPATARSTAPRAIPQVLQLPTVEITPDASREVPVLSPTIQRPVAPARQTPAPQTPKRQRPAPQAPATQSPALIIDGVLAVPPTPARPGYSEFTLDPVTFAPGGSPTPRYPDILNSAGVAGDLILQIVVDTSGLPLENSLKVVRKSHDLFEASFRSVYSQLRFNPATADGRKVRQLVQLVYRFDLEDAPPKPMPPMAPGIATFVIDVTAKPR